jgi:hypothetical protein
MLQRQADHVMKTLAPIAILALLAACADGNQAERHAKAVAAGNGDAAATDEAAAEQAANLVNAVSSGKPGAPVDIRFDIPKRPKVGEPLDIAVAITARGVDMNELRVVFQSNEGVEVRSGAEMLAKDQLAVGTTFAHTVTVVPRKEGVFYLSAVALVESKAGSISRSFAIPIIVGDPVALSEAASKPSQGTVQTDAHGEKIVSLPASDNP